MTLLFTNLFKPSESRPRAADSHARVGVESYDVDVPVSIFATGWQTALTRSPKCETQTVALQSASVRAMSVNLGRPVLKTVSFSFSESSAIVERLATTRSNRPVKPNAATAGKPRTGKPTRIKPPADIIRFEDRLFYLLQPPLEAVFSAAALDFPFEPFPYQYHGIAFLYPRYAAVLADEMGLGKTMQAVTTIRLLLHAGEVRQVLLICPKPLVTNWQREFRLWAPEIPVTVIEGDQAKRQWQWEQIDAPVRIANYELLVRDRSIVCGSDLQFDLVALDEAQRIKNRSSTTAQVVRSINRSRSWALTGTPVENSQEDLVGIFEFLSPGYLNASYHPRKMGKATRDYILRRTKDMVLTDLPPKLYRDADVDLSPEQWETYRAAEEDGVLKLSDMGEEITIHHVFELVLRLKQICNFDPATGVSSKLDRLVADMEEVAASGKKAIVFSQ